MKSSCTTKTLNNHIVAPRTIHKPLFGLLPGRTVILTSRCPSMPLMRFLVAALFVLLCITSAFLAPPVYADHDDSTAGICARTAAVHNAIVRKISGVTDCARVTTAQLAAIEFLSLDSKGITALKAGDFAGLSALTNLDLSNNQLSTLPAGAFTGLSALTELDLHNNQLSTLPAGIFSGLSALTELDLVGNPLDASAIMLLAGLPATVTAITNASGGICTRTEAIRNEIVSRIPGVTDCALVTTEQLAAITYLRLGYAGITTLKAGDFAGLSALPWLFLNNNQLSTLPTGAFTGLSALTWLNLNSNQISTLPTGIFSDLSKLTRLDLQNNQISTLPTGAFSGLSKLTELDLHNNQISTLPTGAFSGLSKLTSLNLQNNQISTLPTGAFSGLSKLTELDLHNNQISTLPTGAFSGLPALRELDLVGNPLDASAIMLLAGLPATITVITNASGGICTRTKAIRNEIVASIAGVTDCALVTAEQLAAITGLGLDGKGITTLKAGDFAGLSALTGLGLRNNQISTLSAGAFSGLSKLPMLDLSNSQISTLPTDAFSGLSALTTLYLNSNQISTLPTGIFSDLSKLTFLALNNNQISTLPADAFTGLSALTRLFLGGNQIGTLPAGAFTGLSALTALSLNGNQLSTLPADTFSGLSKLTSLNLQNNQISILPADAFTGLSALTGLFLAGNQIGTLPAGAFTGLSKLTNLDLHNNQISTLSAGAFTGLSALTGLFLNNNQINTLSAGTFSGLSALTWLDLRNNQISTLPAGIFSDLSVLTRLDLFGNPLDASAIMLLAGLPDARIALAKISTYAGDSSSPAPTLMDYTDAGVMDVSADNLEAVNAAVAAASTAADADTLADIQALAAPAIMTAAANMAALAKISTYAGDSSSPAPTLMDYTDAGVMGVSADNLEAVNMAVAAATAADADTLADIQALAAPAIMTAAAKATALAKISTYAGDSSSPAPTLMDYTDAGVMDVSADNLDAVNAAVAAASTAAEADTLADIQALAAPAIMTAAAKMAALAKISTYAGDASSPAPTLMDYTDAGVMDVSADNLEAVNMAVAAAATAADADTLADIQALVNPAITNNAPTADAGTAQTVAEGAMVTLDGSASSDPEMQTLAYAWTQTTGVDVTLTGANTASPTFTAPANLVTDATLTFSLVVNDGFTNSQPDIVTITVTAGINDAPTANAGPDQTVAEGAMVTLYGSASSDPEMQTLAYAWTQTTGVDVTLTGANTASPTFTAPDQITADATLTFSLMVNDGNMDSPADTVTITVTAGTNDAPTANAGSPQIVGEFETVALSGSGTDPEGEDLTYAWTQTSGRTVIALTGADTASPTFTAPPGQVTQRIRGRFGSVIGELRFTRLIFILTVTDTRGAIGTSLVEIVVHGRNDAPTANAGPDQTVAEGAMVTLDGSASSDPEMQTLAYTWIQTAGVDVTLSDATAASPTFTAPDNLAADATLTFRLSVRDARGLFSAFRSTVEITVTAGINDAPTADAGAAQTVAEGAMVTLDGSTSSDPENEMLTYTWTQTAGTPTVSLSGADTARPTFTAPDQITADAVLTFSLVVNDGNANSQPDTVTITAKAGICARTEAVRNEIVSRIRGVTDCTQVTTEQLAAITYLSFYRRGITTLKAGDFAGLSALTNLDLHNNQISTLPAGAFTGLSALTELDLVGNPLDASAIMLLAGLPATITVITNASGGICTRTKAIRNRIVASIGVTNCASVTTEQLAAITGLSLAFANITNLKAGDLAGLSALTSLDLGNNQISTLSADAFLGLSALTALRLLYNQISTLSAGTFSGLSALTFLDLRENQLSTLPTGIFSDLSVLTRLDLFGNPLDVSAIALLAGLPATVAISVSPVAEAGQPQIVDRGTVVTLDGSASVCFRGCSLTYAWTQTAGTPTVTLSNAHAARPTFTVPEQLPANAVLTFSLVVNDGFTNSQPDTVTITVNTAKMAALAKISTYAADASSPAPTLMDYTDAGVMQVSADNLEAVNMAVAAAASTAADADTLADIQALAAPAIMTAAAKMAALAKISTYAADASNPIPTLMDYTDAGVMDVSADNLEAVNMAVAAAASTAAEADTLADIQALAAPAIMTAAAKMAALAKISTYAADASSPAPTLMDYTDAGVMQVSADNLEAVNMAVAAAASTAAEADTLVKIQALATPAIMTAAANMAALAKISTYAADASSPAPTLMDYTDAGVMDVSADNLEAVNMAVAAAATAAEADTLADIQALAAPAIMTAAAKMAALAKISTYAADASSPAPTLMDYTDAGVMDVSADNLEAVNMAVAAAASTAAEADTLVKIQALATPAIMTAAANMAALAKISTYAADASSPAPTLMDYTDAGVVQVSADNLEAVNMAVAAAATAAEADTLADIQALATPAIMTAAAKAAALAKISTYAADASNPIPTLMDYTDAGVMDVSADNLEAVNMAVAAAASTAAEADTLADIQALAAPAIMTAAAKAAALAKISTYAADASNPAPTLMDYTDAGVMDVSADNLEAVNAAVAAAATADEADTLADIQALATPAIMTAAAKAAALAKISTYAADASNPIPTLMDYTDAGVMDVSADNLEAVNMAVAAAASTAAEADTLADIQALAAPAIMTAAAKAAALAKISTYAADASNPAPTLMDYTDAGVMQVSADNLEAVNMAVAAAASTAAEADTLADIQALAAPAIMTAAAKAAALAKISTYAADASSPAPTLMDYTDAGVMDVSADNLEAVNMAVAAAATAAEADTLADIQALAAPAIMTAAAKMAALAKISTYAGDASSPAPTLMDYTDAGVMDVSADNLEAVNMAVAAAASTAADADTLADIQALAAPAIMTAAAKMAALAKISTYAADASNPIPTLMDYTDAGVMDVSADNLEAVNMAVAAAASTAAEADTLADIQALAAPAIMTAAAKMAALAKISTYAADASSPAPTLMDYTDAGVMQVSADNLEAVNMAVAAAASTAAEADTLVKIQALATPAIMTAAAKMAALAKISTYAADASNPIPTLMDYTDAGVMQVSADNLEAVNMAVAAAASTAAEADTLVKIQALATPAIMTAAANMAALAKISTYAADASSPAPTLMDYTDAGVVQVSADNLEAVNMAVAAAATAAEADTLADIQALATPAIMTAAAKAAALAKISTYAADASNPIPTLMDYTDAGVMDVSADNLEAVNMAVAAAASTAAEADTLADIQALAAPAIMTAAAKAAALAKISTYAADASNPAPTLMDYTDAGVMDVSADNLEAVNAAVAAAATADEADTLADIQALAAPAIMTAAAKAAALAKISTYAADASNPIPTLMDYTDAGVMQVSADNLEAVNMAVAAAASTAAEADTLADIQALAAPAIMTAAAKAAALAKISTYAADASNPAPTLMDYTDAGVMDVSADNLEAVNMAVAAAASTAAEADTLADIQALAAPAIMTAAAKAAALAKISTYAADASSPAPTLMDYTDAGVMDVSADNLEAVNMAVVAAAATAAEADTLADIQALAAPAIMTAAAKMAALAKISTYAGDASSPAPTLMDYTDAGVMDVSADNLEAVNMAVAAAASTAAEADTLADIQALAAPAIMTAAAKMAALAKISTYAADASSPAPTLMDYTDAGVMQVSADNLEAVNMAVAAAATAAEADTLADIQALATPAIMTAAAKMAALAKISTYAGDASSPAPTLMDYTDAGVMDVSAGQDQHLCSRC